MSTISTRGHVLVLLSLVLALSACGGDDEAPSSDGPAAVPDAPGDGAAGGDDASTAPDGARDGASDAATGDFARIELDGAWLELDDALTMTSTLSSIAIAASGGGCPDGAGCRYFSIGLPSASAIGLHTCAEDGVSMAVDSGFRANDTGGACQFTLDELAPPGGRVRLSGISATLPWRGAPPSDEVHVITDGSISVIR